MLLKLVANSNEDCIICNINGGLAANLDEVAEVIGVSSLNATLKDLRVFDILVKIKVDNMWVWVINPYVLHKKSSVSSDFYMAFSNSSQRYVYTEECYEEVLI